VTLPAAPYVLLDDARPGGAVARLYRDPAAVVTAATLGEVPAALEQLRAAGRAGRHIAGYLAYDAGAAFVPGAPVLPSEGPLLWFGLFAGFDEIPDVAALLPDPAGAWAGMPEPAITRDAYEARLARVLDLIVAGDIYQANLTFRSEVPILGDPAALYARLRSSAASGYGALIDTGERQLLSLSPELFFALEGGRLTCRPMKGTARRGTDPAEDGALAAELQADEKQRAENLMIVDLMRNDLSRVARAGSVATPELFALETYPTIHQLTSTVTAELAADRDALDVLAALFPCGSITGAPKRRAMEVIAEVEGAGRGAYTGAIGRIDPCGDAMFNVAIRTLELPRGAGTARLGLGSGIVADSRGDEEWRECLAKAAFVTAGARPVDLIETMAFDPLEGLAHVERHLARMKASAGVLGFTFDRHAARNELQAATFRLRAPSRVRLALARSGTIAIEVSPAPPAPAAAVAVALIPLPVAADDWRLLHKTSDRRFYDKARAAAGTFEVLFTLPDGRLTEGSFTNLFVERDGKLLTPTGPCLPGVLRAELLESGRAVEAELTVADLADGFFVGNALRGLIPGIVAPATVVAPAKGR
jgi:para-aminobenzoate synthetase/4-amino-4-deoxychorismate lyase